MPKKINTKLRLVFCGVVCTIFIAVFFSSVLGKQNNTPIWVNATPITGKWEQNQSRAGWGNFTWDVQLLNTNPTYFNWTIGQDHITFLKAGYYQINVNVALYIVQETTGFIELKRNNEILSRAQQHGTAGELIDYHFSDAEYFKTNDSIFIYCHTNDYPLVITRYGADMWSTMSIVRLN